MPDVIVFMGLTMRRFALAALLLALLESAGLSSEWKPTLLSFPALSQKDPQNYHDATLMAAEDSLNGQEFTVSDLACLATVYTIIERGLGKPESMIDDFYPDPRKQGGKTSGPKKPDYVEGEVDLNSENIVAALNARLPTILHGTGGAGPIKEHFILVVGLAKQTDSFSFLGLDPWPGSDRSGPGRKAELIVQKSTLVDPTSSISFTHMRLLDGTSVNTSGVQASDPSSLVWAPNQAPAEDPWVSTPKGSIAAVLRDPEKLQGQVLKFYGTPGEVYTGPKRKQFTFQELVPVNPQKAVGWDDWLSLTQPGATITVLWEDCYNRMAESPEGRNIIRSMANLTMPMGAMGPKFQMIARVREFSDTFEAYLELLELKPAPAVAKAASPTAQGGPKVTPGTPQPSDSNEVSRKDLAQLAEKNLGAAYEKLRATLDAAGKRSLGNEELQFMRSRRRKFEEYSLQWIRATEERTRELQERLGSSK